MADVATSAPAPDGLAPLLPGAVPQGLLDPTQWGSHPQVLGELRLRSLSRCHLLGEHPVLRPQPFVLLAQRADQWFLVGHRKAVAHQPIRSVHRVRVSRSPLELARPRRVRAFGSRRGASVRLGRPSGSGSADRPRQARRLSSGVEQLTRNEQVRGSNPRGGSIVKSRDIVNRCPGTSFMSVGCSFCVRRVASAVAQGDAPGLVYLVVANPPVPVPAGGG